MKFALIIAVFFINIVTFADEYKILAVVNGESISSQQLKDRVDIIINSSGLRNDAVTRKKLNKETIEILINEKLQEQEAKAKNIALLDQELEMSMKDLEARNNLASGGFKKFIQGKGLSYTAAMEQIKASLLWKKTMQRTLKAGVKVTDEEVKREQQKYASREKKIFVNLSEIILPLNLDNPAESKKNANKIVADARAGKDFGKLAAEFSAGRTSKAGGQIGWIEEKAVIAKIRPLVTKTSAGGVSDPLIVDDALYVIIKVNDRKIIDPAEPNKIKEGLMMAKLEKESRKYIKQLRQKAYIEKKFKEGEL